MSVQAHQFIGRVYLLGDRDVLRLLSSSLAQSRQEELRVTPVAFGPHSLLCTLAVLPVGGGARKFGLPPSTGFSCGHMLA